MTDYRDRVVEAMLVPAVIFNEPQIYTVASGSIKSHYDSANIQWPERVHGMNSRRNDFVMVVDDCGKDKGFKYNPRAQYLSGYPLDHPIVGDVLFLSEAMLEDGVSFVNLSAPGQRWLTATERQDDYEQWCLENAPTIALFTMRYPGRI